MKIEPKIEKDGSFGVIITEFYGGVGLTLKTNEGKELNICLRDYGFDMNIDGGMWHHVDNDDDFSHKKVEIIVECGSCGKKFEFGGYGICPDCKYDPDINYNARGGYNSPM